MELSLEALKPEYARLWDTMEIREDRRDEVSWAVSRIKRNREASERKFDQRHGFDPDPDLPGAA